MSDTSATRAVRRVREEMQRKNLSQSDIAGRLDWTQTRVSKLLNGKIALGLEELDALCFAVGLSLVEAVRDHGLEFCADMTPTELRVLERYRQLSPPEQDALSIMLKVKGPHTRLEDRRATIKKPVIPKGRNAS